MKDLFIKYVSNFTKFINDYNLFLGDKILLIPDDNTQEDRNMQSKERNKLFN